MTEERNENFVAENEETVVETASEPVEETVVEEVAAEEPVAEEPVAEEAFTPAFCTACGSPLREGAVFCSSCGKSLVDEPVAEETAFNPIPAEPVKKKKMGKKGKIAIIVAIIVVVLALAGFGITKLVAGSMAEDKAVGMWKSEEMYLESYGSTCERWMEIEYDGTYYGLVVDVDSGYYEDYFYGTWHMEGGKIALEEEDSYGTAYYKYHLNDTLTNGDVRYERIQ